MAFSISDLSIYPGFNHHDGMELSFSAWAVILPYGVLASGLGTLVGLGGGAFVVPVLVLGYGVPLKTAVVAVTFSLLPSAFLSTLFNIQRKQIDFFAAACLEVPTIVGAIAGAYLTKVMPVRPMEILFGLFMLYMGTRLLRKKNPQHESIFMRLNRLAPRVQRGSGAEAYTMGIPALGVFGVAAGLIAGMFGVGGGIIKTPVMLRIFNMPTRRATATSIFMIMFTSATATFSHWRMGTMDWKIALPIGASFFCGSFIANSWGARFKSSTLEKLLAYTILAASLAFWLHLWMN